MAVTTLDGHIDRAKDFYNTDSFYFGIGKSSPWDESTVKDWISDQDYDMIPPIPSSTDPFLEAVGFKKVEQKFLVVQDDTGTLEYRNYRWRIVDPSMAHEEKAHWVYLSSYLNYGELPVNIVYRQVALFSDLKLAEGVSDSKYALLPDEVASMGNMQVLDNRKPVFRDSDLREHIKMVIEL